MRVPPEALRLLPDASCGGRLGRQPVAMQIMSEGWSVSGKKERVAQEVQLSAQSSAVNRAALTRCLEAARRSQSRRTSCRVQRPESLLSTKAPGVWQTGGNAHSTRLQTHRIQPKDLFWQKLLHAFGTAPGVCHPEKGRPFHSWRN